MNLRRAALAVAGSAALSLWWLIRAVAWLLSPFRLGRLLQSVSVPRLADHRLRTTLTVLGIALGVAVFIAVVVVNRSVLRGVAATFDDLAGKTDLQIGAGTSGFSETLLDSVRETPGVARVAPVLQQTASIRDPRLKGERLLVLGIDLIEDSDQHFRDYGSPELDAIRRDPVAFLNSPTNILISHKLAERFGYKLHDKIVLATGSGIREFDIWGFLDDSGVGRAFGGAVAVMYHQAMQIAFERDRNVDRIDVALEPGAQLPQVEAALRNKLGSGFTIEQPARKGERIAKMLIGVRSALTIASLIALLVGAFLIHNTMAISVVQRRREIGILRAIGSTRGEVIRLLTLEGTLLGIVGGLLGVGIGSALSHGLLAATSRALSQAYLQLATTEVQIDPTVLLLGFALGVIASALASFLPARYAVADEPVVALRTGSVMSPQRYPTGLARNDVFAALLIALAWPLLYLPVIWQLPLGAFAATFTLLAAASLLLPRLVQALAGTLERFAGDVLGLEARLAHQNLPRDIARTSTTASALMAGVALAIAFATFTTSFATTVDAWVAQTLPGDLFITQSASMAGTSMRNVPMADSMRADLLAMPEVEGVRRVRIVELPYGGLTIKAVASDMDVFMRHARLSLLEGERDELLRGLKTGGVSISENFSRRFGVHRGDTIALSGNRGTRHFQVLGVHVDYTSDIGSVLFERAIYVEVFDDPRVDTYELYLKNAGDAERVRQRVNAQYGADRDLFVLTNGEFKAEVSRTTEQIFTLVRALEIVALIVAVLGIINAQLANVLDRIREIGVLRALGMLRSQASRMIVIEAALVGGIGTLAGVLLGLALGYVLLAHINLVQTGWYFPYHVSLASIAEVSLLTLPAAALAGFYPAREAARLVITDALEYE